MLKLIVRNERVLSDYFQIPLKMGEDLCDRKEAKIKKFITAYEKILFQENYDKLESFTQETGINILRVYHLKGEYDLQEFYVDELGIFAKYENDYGIEEKKEIIWKHHLTVHLSLDKIVKEKNGVYGFVDGDKKLIYQTKRKCDKRVDKENLIPKSYLSQGEVEKVKQIECIYPFEDTLILFTNGDLFVNGKCYAKRVREVCPLTVYRTYIVFEDERVELYTCPFMKSSSPTSKNRKVLTVPHFFIAALTEERDLFISTIGSDDCDNDFDLDNCLDFYLSDIDDFTYTYDSDNKVATLNLIVGNQVILFPLYIRVRK